MESFASKIDDNAKSGTVANWETDKNLPNNKRLKRISELGNVTVEFLLNGAESEIELLRNENEHLRKTLKDAKGIILSMLDGGYKSRNDIYSVLADIRDVLKVGED